MREFSVPKENAVDFIETIAYIYFNVFSDKERVGTVYHG